MEITVEMAGSVAIVTVQLDQLDLSVSAEFRHQFMSVARDYKQVVLDLSGVSFVDSSGLGAILAAFRELAAEGGGLKLCCISSRIATLLELVRMDRILSIFDTREQAVGAFASPAHR